MATSRTVSALLALRGRPQPLEARVEPAENAVIIDGRRVDASELDWDTPAIGCLYGVALNFRGLLEALEPEFHRPPHDRPPLAPVLYIKPRNTWLAHRRSVPVPTGVDAVEIGATLAVVIGRDARRVARHQAARGDCRLYHRQRHQPPERRTLPSTVARQVPRRVLPSGAMGRTA